MILGSFSSFIDPDDHFHMRDSVCEQSTILSDWGGCDGQGMESKPTPAALKLQVS